MPSPAGLPAPAELYDQPPAWLAYAAAKLATGDTGGAELALQSASEPGGRVETSVLACLISIREAGCAGSTQMSGVLIQRPSAAPPAGTPAQLLAQAVCASMQLHCMAGRPHQALQHLQQQLVLLRGARVLMRDMEGLWETAVAGAAAARDWQLLQKALLSAQTWAAEADDGSAAFLAKLHGLEAAGRLAAEQAQQAARQYSRAVHLCPTDAGLRVGLAGAVLMQPAAAASSPEVALRLLDSPAVVAAAVAGNRTASVAPAGKVRARVRRMWVGCIATHASIVRSGFLLQEAGLPWCVHNSGSSVAAYVCRCCPSLSWRQALPLCWQRSGVAQSSQTGACLQRPTACTSRPPTLACGTWLQ